MSFSTLFRLAAWCCLLPLAFAVSAQTQTAPQASLERGLQAKLAEFPYEALAHFKRAQAGFAVLGDQGGEAKACLEAGRTCFQIGNYVQAARWLEKAGGLAKTAHGEKSVEYADVLLELGWTHGQNWQFGQERTQMERALAIFQKAKDPQRIALAHLLLGRSYLDEQHYPEARKHLLEAQKRYDKIPPDNPEFLVRMHGYLASLYGNFGWHKLEKLHEQRAKDAFAKLPSPRGLRWANLLTHAHVRGCFTTAQADSLTQKVDSIFTSLLGERSIGKLNALFVRSGFVESRDSAKVMLRRALRICEDSLGRHTASYVNIINQLGLVYNYLGQQDSALFYFKKAYSALTNSLVGASNPNALTIRGNVADASAKKGGDGCTEALRIFRELRQAKKEKYGERSLPYANGWINFFNCLYQTQPDSLLDQMQFFEKTVGQLFGDSTAWLAQVAWWRGHFYANQKNQEKAVRHYLQALELGRRSLDENDPFFSNTYGALHGQYIGISSRPNADSALYWQLQELRFYERNDAFLPSVKQAKLAGIYGSLPSDYASVGKFDSASFYQQKSVELLDERQPDYVINMFINACSALQNLHDRPGAERYYRMARAAYFKKKKSGAISAFDEQYALGYTVLYHVIANDCDSANYYFPIWLEATRVGFGQDTVGFHEQRLSIQGLILQACDPENADAAAALLAEKLDLLEKAYGGPNCANGVDYGMLASKYLNLGKREKARQFQERYLACLSKWNAADPDNPVLRAQYLSEQAWLERNFGNLDSALATYLQILKDSTFLKPDFLAATYGSLGTIYLSKKDYDNSTECFCNAVTLLKGSPDANFYRRQVAENELEKRNFPLATKLLDEILNDKISLPDSIACLTAYGRVLRRQGKYERAVATFLQVVDLQGGQRSGDFDPEQVRHAKPADLRNAYAKVAFAYLRWYWSSKKRAHLEAALQFNNYTLEAIRYDQEQGLQRLQSEADNLDRAVADRLLERGESLFEIYEDAILIRLSMHELSKDPRWEQEAFSLMEQGKLALFGQLENLLKNEERRRQRSLVDKLRAEFDNTVKNYSLNSEQAAAIQKKYEEELRKAENQECYKEVNIETTTVSQVQKELLLPGQTLLEYSFTDSAIVIAVVGKNSFKMHRRQTPLGLLDTLKTFRREVARAKPDLNAFVPAARKLYDELIAPVRSLLTTKNLVIVPDGELLYLPFEALLSGGDGLMEGYADLPFLVKDFNVSYGMSAAHLLETREKVHRRNFTYEFVGFAPSYAGLTEEEATKLWAEVIAPAEEQRAGFGELHFNRQEIETVANTFFPGGKHLIYLDTAATKRAFLNFPSPWLPRILHLGLHAKSNDRDGRFSFLVFAYLKTVEGESKRLDIRVTADEFMKREANFFPVEMVVLSGCETGLGELYRGEGIIGFNRAFSFAGAKSIVSSLWSVDDQGTESLMVRFYKQLKDKGLPKNEAMRAAKLEMLADGKTPYFWASFVVYGETGALWKK